MASVCRSRIIGIATTLTEKISRRTPRPRRRQATMKPMFSGSSRASSEPLKSGMPSKLTANTTSVARPQSISSTSSTKPKMPSVPERVDSKASSDPPKSGRSPRSSRGGSPVQTQAQERPHQQEARRQRQHVGRRMLEHFSSAQPITMKQAP
jgi:hypothetical protein